MAIPTDRSNPSFEDHVSNLVNKYNSTSDETKIAGHRWYRQAANDVVGGMHVGHTAEDYGKALRTGQHVTDVAGGWGHVPGTLTRDTSHGEQGARMGSTTYTDNPASSKRQSGLPFKRLREISNAAENEHILKGKEEGGMGEALNRAERGLPQSRPSDAPAGSYLASQQGGPKPGSALHRSITAAAALSPAGATGMTWNDNVRATAELSHLSDGPGTPNHPSAIENMRQVNAMPSDPADYRPYDKKKNPTGRPQGTPAAPGTREAASDQVRGTYMRGKGLTHAGLGNTIKGHEALTGKLQPNKQGNLLGNTKTQHFANDIMLGTDEGDKSMRSNPMHGTIDKHQADAIGGERNKWSAGTDATRVDQRADLNKQLATKNIPSLSSNSGYAYSRDVVHEAASRLSQQHGREILPHHLQATTWGQQKMESDASADSNSKKGEAARAQAQLADEATRTPSPLSGKQFS